MAEEPSPPGEPYQLLDPRTVAALRVLLAIDADTAGELRERSPARRRPVAQYGPRLDLGDDGGPIDAAPDNVNTAD